MRGKEMDFSKLWKIYVSGIIKTFLIFTSVYLPKEILSNSPEACGQM